ncbi:adenylate cyclase [Gillisia mitskevichiae]|uniref:Adenylate cyclase n=1 Tax=Gillisia mitskevichiae TaxID=270921 RepID=A0A495PZE0_9FLAO|nr:adenylate/guanylate cyclase domain-containing protein [Gillisia mitskevichiae]RKS55890.1 adenylate cyclase [Gillisia mitskevichiae]
MDIRPKTRIQLYQIVVITVFWVLCGGFFALYKCVTYDLISENFIFIVPHHLSLTKFFIINLIGPAIGGLLGGSVIVFRLNEKYRNRSYRYYLVISILYFFGFIFTLNSVMLYEFYYKNRILNNVDPLQEAINLLILDPYAIRNLVSWMIIVFFTLHGLKIYEKFGPGTLFSMFLGKFHRPHEVHRVFMFLDITNSTSIAEKLGHSRFFTLLRDFYNNITDSILNSHGNIYQYVGDEIIVSWLPMHASSKNLNCINCFFKIEDAIAQNQSYYLNEYGFVPGFKAAVHRGEVVMGEIGIIKREIVYSGDILNTTSRMMEQCKIYNEKLIISKDVLQVMNTNGNYTMDFIGNMTLRGKSNSLELYGVKRKYMPVLN